MNMPPASLTPAERARKALSIVLQRLQPDGTQVHLALALGVSESTITRRKEGLEDSLQLVAHLGLKLVDEANVCVPDWEIRMLRKAYARTSEQAPWLLND